MVIYQALHQQNSYDQFYLSYIYKEIVRHIYKTL